ncbi:MAG: flagellar export chaperone FliS [Oceanospirillum sp.]|nr:flagellar export chaperone FliS [Oceanospirillum sp.]
MRSALQQYKNVNLESDIESASPYRITQMLMEGCVRFLKQARFAMEKKDYEKKSYFISKSEAILLTLAGSLDRDKSPELHDNLSNLYAYAIDRLIEASVSMDVEVVDEVISIVGTIKAGWDAIPREEIEKAERLRQGV